MHETSLLTQTPQGSRSQFVGCVLRSNLNDSIACADVMQQIVSERMDDLVAQGLWNRKRATIHNRSSGRSDDGFYMAGAATQPPEKVLTLESSRSCCKRYVARWNHGAAYELSKVVDVSQAKVVWLIVNARRGVKNLGNLRRTQPVRDSHFVEVGIRNKREQAAVLILPAEASDTGLSRSLENGGLHNLPVNSSFTQRRLPFCNRNKSAVVNGFHKSIPKCVEGSAQCADIFRRRYVLLGLRTDGAIIDDRPAGNRVFFVVDNDCRVYEIAIFIIVPNPEFRDLASCPAIRILMASDAGGGVVHRSKPILDRLVLLIDILIVSKRVSGRFGYSIADALCAVEAGSVEPSRRFFC